MKYTKSQNAYMSEDGPTMKAPHRSPKTNTDEAVGTYHSLLQTKLHCGVRKGALFFCNFSLHAISSS